MIRGVWYVTVAVGALVVVAVTDAILLWLGRSETPRGEMVVDADLVEDDPGHPIDDGDFDVPCRHGSRDWCRECDGSVS